MKVFDLQGKEIHRSSYNIEHIMEELSEKLDYLTDVMVVRLVDRDCELGYYEVYGDGEYYPITPDCFNELAQLAQLGLI